MKIYIKTIPKIKCFKLKIILQERYFFVYISFSFNFIDLSSFVFIYLPSFKSRASYIQLTTFVIIIIS